LLTDRQTDKQKPENRGFLFYVPGLILDEIHCNKNA